MAGFLQETPFSLTPLISHFLLSEYTSDAKPRLSKMERVSISIQVLKVILPLLTKQQTFAYGKHDKDQGHPTRI